MGKDARSSARIVLSAPPYRPIGVRVASQIKASAKPLLLKLVLLHLQYAYDNDLRQAFRYIFSHKSVTIVTLDPDSPPFQPKTALLLLYAVEWPQESSTTPFMPQGTHAYRPEIDGLRMIAVLPVVLYHF